jgi:nicotinamide-nucleotide amidase
MLEAVIQDRLLCRAGSSRLFRRVLKITGQSESSVEEKMQPLYARWLTAPTKIITTILASLGQIELHLTAFAPTPDQGQRALDAAVSEVQNALGRDLFSTDGRSMQEVVGGLLRERGFRISAAESCTGGLLMARLTEVPGSSDYVDRGVVVYSNQAKTDLLGVPPELIEQHGAVSEPVAEAMASGMVRIARADIAVGITGVAGPGGGTPEKPVGRVVVAAAWVRNDAIETRVRTFNFVGGREMVRFQASQAALDMVRRWMTQFDHTE